MPQTADLPKLTPTTVPPPPEEPAASTAPAPVLADVTLRFTHPALFVEFLLGPFTRRILDLRLAEPPVRGGSMWVVLQVDGLRDPVRLRGKVHEHLGDGRTRIVLAGDAGVQAWLGGFVSAWQVGGTEGTGRRHPSDAGETVPRASEGTGGPRHRGGEAGGAPSRRAVDPRQLAERLDQLSYYELLGVAPEAAPEDVQAAFHALSRAYHPDLFHGGERADVSVVNRIFRRINEAYSVLRVPPRRRAYDEGLSGPRGQWRLRWREDEEAARRRSAIGLDPRDRGEHYWGRAVALLDRNSASRTDVAATVLRLLRAATAFEPDQKEYSQLLDDLVAGRPLHRKRAASGRANGNRH